MQERFKVWVTTYALTDGILTGVAESIDAAAIKFYWRGIRTPIFKYGNEWHRTEESAIQRAEEMRALKIESLRKRIAKLEAMTFDKKAP